MSAINHENEATSSRRRKQVVATAAATVIISGRNIAHAKRSPGQRAILAADILTGKVKIDKPTMKQVANLLRVSTVYVERALRINGDPDLRQKIRAGVPLNQVMPAGNGLVAAWTKASPKERAQLGQLVGPDVLWDEAVSPAIE